MGVTVDIRAHHQSRRRKPAARLHTWTGAAARLNHGLHRRRDERSRRFDPISAARYHWGSAFKDLSSVGQ